MKKLIFLCATCLILSVLTGCQPILNHGVYSANPDSDNLSKISINRFIVTETIDNSDVNWESDSRSSDVVQLDSGVHTFGLLYHDNQGLYTRAPQKITALFEAGRNYRIIPVVSFMEVHFDVVDEETQQSVTIDIAALADAKANDNYLSNYTRFILDPTTQEDGKTVIEECDDFILYDEPDQKFTMVYKKTGEVLTGHRAFLTDFTQTGGTVYLKFDDGTVTTDEFLASRFQEEADIIMIVTDCDRNSVTYTYIKPDDLKGKVITLAIR